MLYMSSTSSSDGSCALDPRQLKSRNLTTQDVLDAIRDQNVHVATIIPAAAIPISLIGTFTAMGMLGFSINTLTLFGLVLAIGVVVDDAIVIVENVTRLMDEDGLSSREAAMRTMQEVSGPVIATSLV